MSISKPYIMDMWRNKPLMIEVKQNDSNRKIKAQLVASNNPIDLQGKSVRYYINKTDGNKVFNDCEIINPSNGDILIPLTNQSITDVGTNNMQIAVYEGSKLESSYTVYLQVSETLIDNESIESSNEFKALDDALGRVVDIGNRFEEVNAHLEDMSKYLNYMPVNGGTFEDFDGNGNENVMIDGGTY